MGTLKPLRAVERGHGGPARGRRRDGMSLHYTTRWNVLARVRA
jgi:hypothetical protein